MTDIAGHAVRCMYLYCGMADVAAMKRIPAILLPSIDCGTTLFFVICILQVG